MPELLDPRPAGHQHLRLLLFTRRFPEPAPCAYSEGTTWPTTSRPSNGGRRGLYVIVDFHQDAFSRYALDGWAARRAALGTDRPGRAGDARQRPELRRLGSKAAPSASRTNTSSAFFRDDKQALSHYRRFSSACRRSRSTPT